MAPSPPPHLPILFQSLDIIIINKPHNLNIDGKNHLHTVESILPLQEPRIYERNQEAVQNAILKGQQLANRQLRFVHQLDYATSGILCMAMTRKACSCIGKCFQQRSVKKRYTAVVKGWIGSDESSYSGKQRLSDTTTACGDSSDDNIILIESYIADDLEDPRKFKMKWFDLEDSEEAKQNGGKLARTRVYILKRGYLKMPSNHDGDDSSTKVTHVHLDLLTGRRHQLRLHLSHIGHPIVGDATYNDHGDSRSSSQQQESSASSTRQSQEKRLLLHSMYLEIPLDLEENKKPYTSPHNLPKGRTVIETKDPFESMIQDGE